MKEAIERIPSAAKRVAGLIPAESVLAMANYGALLGIFKYGTGIVEGSTGTLACAVAGFVLMPIEMSISSRIRRRVNKAKQGK